MVRSAAAVLALLLLPGAAPAQQVEGRSHTVEPGNTLWTLAQAYYGDPHQWTRIFDANRDRLQDPDRLEPGLVLRIPGEGTATVRAVSVEGASAPSAAARRSGGEPAVPQERRGPPPRTVFYPEPVSDEPALAAPEERLAFSPDDFHRAHWLVPRGETPGHTGRVEGLADARALRHSAQPNDRVRLAFLGAPPVPGERLQVFRVDRTVEGLGQVVVPTGTLVVTERTPDGALATVEDLYAWMAAGDLVRPLPEFPLTAEMAARPASAGTTAPVLGFGSIHQIHSPGDYLFLGAGTDEGVRIGDVFEVVWEGRPDAEEAGGGSVQVVSVHDGYSTARIVDMENPVFATGVVLRLSRRMQ